MPKPNEQKFRNIAKRQLSQIVSDTAIIYGTINGDFSSCNLRGSYTSIELNDVNVKRDFLVKTGTFVPEDKSFTTLHNFFFQAVAPGEVKLHSVACKQRNKTLNYIIKEKLSLQAGDVRFLGNLHFKLNKNHYLAESYKTKYTIDRNFSDKRPSEAIKRIFKTKPSG